LRWALRGEKLGGSLRFSGRKGACTSLGLGNIRENLVRMQGEVKESQRKEGKKKNRDPES